MPELTKRRIDYTVIESGLIAGSYGDHEVLRAESIDAMAECLRKLNVTHIIGCVDPSITYADKLCAQLGLSFNGLRLSEARRNKALMSEAVRKAGLRVPACCETASPDALTEWLSTTTFPVVLKPVASGGSDNVHLCESATAAMAAFEKIIGRTNLMGTLNVSVLAQEYVDGTEYVVDCVSFDGLHVPVDLFEYQKGTHNGRAFVYEKERFLRFDHVRGEQLRAFACSVLDVLEFRTGASHMELKINSRGEVIFIEVGARLCGADTHKMVRDTRSDGRSQLDFSIDAVLGAQPPALEYTTARDGLRVYIISTREGRLAGFRNVDRIRALPSYARLELNVQPGTEVTRTTDMSNDVGWVDLVNSDPLALDADEKLLDEVLVHGVLNFE